VELEVLLQCFYLGCHRSILVDQILSLLRLKLELTRQLLILLDSLPRCPLQLIIRKVQHVSLDLLDLEKHLLAHLLHPLVLLLLEDPDGGVALLVLDPNGLLEGLDLHLDLLPLVLSELVKVRDALLPVI